VPPFHGEERSAPCGPFLHSRTIDDARARAQYAGWTSGTRRRDAASRIVAPAGRASESRWWWAYNVQEQYKGGDGGEMISEEECFEDK
jgi:hypothetical protein